MSTVGSNIPTWSPRPGCETCDRLHADLNATIYAVHEYIQRYHDRRFEMESYSGDLGHLIQAQLAAHDRVLEHEQGHWTEDQQLRRAG
jgi:hypothetical protein